MPTGQRIEFIPAPSPITGHVTKFGGQPAWLERPQWPLSRTTGNPMRFICQVRLDDAALPGAAGKMAYVFMTDEDEYVDGTWEPDGGENAVVVQSGLAPTHVATAPQATGPTLYDMVQMPGRDRLVPVGREYRVAMTLACPPDAAHEDDAFEGSKIGGSPMFLQYDDYPDDGEWRLLLQLDSAQAPFSVNFGDAGVAYVFVDPAGQRAKMLWQCG